MRISIRLMIVAVMVLLGGRARAGEQATAVASVIGGLVASINVVSGGSGYDSEPSVIISGGGGSGATAKAVVSNGRISFVIILSAGFGYSGVPDVFISAPPSIMIDLAPRLILYGEDGLNVLIESSVGSLENWTRFAEVSAAKEGRILPVSSFENQSQFYRIKNLNNTGSIGVGGVDTSAEKAVAIANVIGGFVANINVVTGGSGYLLEPKVTLVGGGGSGATARAFLSGDRVSLVVVLTAGSGYTSAPIVIVEPPPIKTQIKFGLSPSIKVSGQAWSKFRVETSFSKTGPWTVFTNSAFISSGVVTFDLMPGFESRFYRVAEIVPPGCAGFVWINPGVFTMGSPDTEVGRYNLSKWEEVQHEVTISRGFWMSDHEVTQAEYRAIMGRGVSNPGADSLPVVNVSWNNAVQYCEKLTERERLAGRINSQSVYRLPTEAEWEYACRAGTTGARYGNINDIAWINNGSESSLRSVRLKKPNAWGLYDMLGNAWELCSDWWWDYGQVAMTDPIGPTTGKLKIVRGASWNFDPTNLRAAGRFRSGPEDSQPCMGFRPVLSELR